ncbi:FAD-dependent oxidoreductase [Salsipaludibacter albus]|uniref:FAD-dependent oxidoreductase n=1 Tax=Salsipaludibacter albus TaxID=2849650 RepID=UPI001EE3C596
MSATTEVEVVVVGGGAMGASTAWHLAARGHDVVVFDRFGPGHPHGSSHGNARIFRLAYPDADYLALARAALPLWDRLEAESGRHLRHRMGELDHGEPAVVAEIARQLAAAGVAHETLSPAEASRRWPGLVVDRAAVFHPDGGTTDATETVRALTELAAGHGAAIHHGRGVAGLAPGDDHVVVDLEPRGDGATTDRVVARTVVVTGGAWAPGLLSGHVSLPTMVVTREQPVHFAPTVATTGAEDAEPWPSFIHYSHDGPPQTSGAGEPVWGYGLPTPDGRIKLGEHHTGEVVGPTAPVPDRAGATPDWGAPDIDPDRLARVVAYARRWVPGIDPDSAAPERCLYTTTPSTDFVLDRAGRLVVGAGFSGHGFKFVPRIGQLLADLATDDTATTPRRFRLPG